MLSLFFALSYSPDPPPPATMAVSDTTPNTPAVGLVFDINPADPVVISVLVGVACLLLAAAVCMRNGKGNQSRGGSVEEEEEEERPQEGQVNVCCGVFASW